MSRLLECPCENCAGVGGEDVDEATVQRWDEQRSLARHLEVWRVERGLSFADAADVLDLLLMLDDERLERAMQGEDVWSQ